MIVAFMLIGPARSQCSADVHSVARHIGAHVVFCGTPSGIKCAEPGGNEPVYIDFGGPYPQNAFSLTLPANAVGNGCERLRDQLMGHELRTEGRVDTLVGKPVIALEDIGDIVISDP